MIKKLLIACAGAGKTTRIIKEAIELTNSGIKVLIITYTTNNQTELINKFQELNGTRWDLFIVKGWYSFLLEEIIRPYQNCIFNKRISGIVFTESNPHKKGNYTIKGTKEKNKNKYNEVHYLNSKNQVYTEFMSKLASRIIEESKINVFERIDDIYGRMYIDEVQDLAGWDFDVIKHLAESKKLEIYSVGDFRQTIYHTSSNPKKPKEYKDKIDQYQSIGFVVENMNECFRSIQEICIFADKVHVGEGYEKTISKVKKSEENTHTGIYYVNSKEVDKYILEYNPLILKYRFEKKEKLTKKNNEMTFGQAKGKTVKHVLIYPTPTFIKFLKGDIDAFKNDKTPVNQNKLYVAITRARYSVAFVVDDAYFNNMLWK